jgi:predicted nucleic acid-binding protein
MTRVVVDASVAIKWLLPHWPNEADAGKALALRRQIDRQAVIMIQPPHFVAEVIAVVARIEPNYVERLLTAVSQLEMILEDCPEIYCTAIRLSVELNYPLFDTLYHAVALNTPNTILITGDEDYYRKAHVLGCIVCLQNYAP